ncbi:glycosyltransferase [Paraglaciecola sp. MB-3u-78]|jgi:hypothetical protein|uniref:glycosyltransferase n=1 Tax=Paraglaciecola sp. MB-3u-78 TaxID=2058332 RepID=UPI000C3208DF|nr:glycosyltransferase [Paraglaciecola sp. MB-3u-78]PKG98109.1 hypothetical protein CXF95_17130 [Paraglaciecola sp. MB-3u-78]
MKNNQKSVLLFTIFGTGHNLVHFNIVIKAMIDKGHQITLVLPENCINKDSYNTHILPYLSHVKIITHQHQHVNGLFLNSWRECGVLRDTILFNNSRYDAILALNCSQIPFLWPIFRIFNLKALKNMAEIKFGMSSTGLNHAPPTIKTKVNNLIRKTLLSLHTDGALKTIDAYAFSKLKNSSPRLQNAYTLIPDPMDKVAIVDKISARGLLGIPDDVFVVSISGSINSHPRKNCPLLISALSDQRINKKICLLIAGKLTPDINEYIKKSQAFQDKRIFVMDRYLSDEELTTITCASDLVCTPYSGHYCPSGIVLRAVKCDVPVLVPNYHWFKFMVDTFNIGCTLKTLTKSTIIDSLNEISEGNGKLRNITAQRMLVKKYFSEDNFAAHWLSQFEGYHPYSFEELLVDYNN